MSNTTLTPGLHWAHPIVLYAHMYVTTSSRFLYKVYTLTPVQCHTRRSKSTYGRWWIARSGLPTITTLQS